MANSIYQGKINRQLWGKLIRHFSKTLGLQYVTWGGAFFILKHKNCLLCP